MSCRRGAAAYGPMKRALDVGLLFITSPITVPVAAITALIIRVIDGAPVIFRQWRIGQGGRQFAVIKFRTMRPLAEGFTTDTQRVTRLGRLVRSLSLDEVPQLINVARGEMSLVGPRPLPVEYARYFSPEEDRRHTVPPGITGFAQTSGRNFTSWDDRLALDVQYVERRSLIMDLSILVKTARQMISRTDVQPVPSEHGARRLDAFRSFPKDGRLRLRPLAQEDLATRVVWMNHPTVREQMSIEGAIDEAGTAAWFKKHKSSSLKHDFAVVEIATGSVVAMTGISDSPNGGGVLYFLSDPARRGEGIGRAAAALTVRWAFEHRGYQWVRSSIRTGNEPSLRIHRALGFRAEAEGSGRVSMVLSLSDWLEGTCSIVR